MLGFFYGNNLQLLIEVIFIVEKVFIEYLCHPKKVLKQQF